jgi:hypothetical protein
MTARATRSRIERSVSELADSLGWAHHRPRCPGLDPEGYADGFPPYVLVRGGRLVFVMVRSREGLTRPEAVWVERLAAVRAVEVLVVFDELGSLARLLTRRPTSNGSQSARERRADGDRRPVGAGRSGTQSEQGR